MIRRYAVLVAGSDCKYSPPVEPGWYIGSDSPNVPFSKLVDTKVRYEDERSCLEAIAMYDLRIPR